MLVAPPALTMVKSSRRWWSDLNSPVLNGPPSTITFWPSWIWSSNWGCASEGSPPPSGSWQLPDRECRSCRFHSPHGTAEGGRALRTPRRRPCCSQVARQGRFVASGHRRCRHANAREHPEAVRVAIREGDSQSVRVRPCHRRPQDSVCPLTELRATARDGGGSVGNFV